jgi:hypothetical protein
MVARRTQPRPTRELIAKAHERFYACEACYKSEAFDTIEDVLAPLRLNQREPKRLLTKLMCPRCESQVHAGTLVVAATWEQLQQARLSKKFDALYGVQVGHFREFLVRYPMLGMEHPFGKVLSQAMERARKTTLAPADWYRATRNTEQPKFGPRPSHESTKANRYNQIGQAAWYLGSDEKTAAVEVMRDPKTEQPVSMAKVKLLEPITVLDLRSVLWGEDPTRQWILRNVVDSRFISEPTSDLEDTRPEYRIPQFIADLARRRKFRGILYDSTRPSAYNNPEAAGHNLVIFDPVPAHAVESEVVVEFGEPDYDPFSLERWPLRRVVKGALLKAIKPQPD